MVRVDVSTADLCDTHGDAVSVADPGFVDLGGRDGFGGVIATVRVFEDNVLVRAALEEAGVGRVLVVDGGGSRRCALLGDMLAATAIERGWSGVIVNGCVRDASALGGLPLGVKALGTDPRRSAKEGGGERGEPVTFAGVTFVPGCFVYADIDGIVVSEHRLDEPG
jgi:regulator of ribonuclease activity A